MQIDVIAMDNLYAYSLLLVIFVGLSIVLATSKIGWQLGVRADGRGGNNISALEQSLLGVLALMIGFTFLMALTRFEGSQHNWHDGAARSPVARAASDRNLETAP
jgi:hypothetical protein